MKRIAIQGTLGSYHDIAAHKYAGEEEIEVICCFSFEDIFKTIRNYAESRVCLPSKTPLPVVVDSWQANEQRKEQNINKANIVFSLPTPREACHKSYPFYNINLTKIQSLPIIGREWEYLFYIDVVFNDYLRYKQAITAIMPLTKKLKTLGEYAEGKSSI